MLGGQEVERIWKNLREKKKYLQNILYVIIFKLKNVNC